MFNKTSPLKGSLKIPGDKSISHRAVMFSSLAKGTAHIDNFLNGADCLSTIDCFRRLGVSIEMLGDTRVRVTGSGLYGLHPFASSLSSVDTPSAPTGSSDSPASASSSSPITLDVGNSGTTIRLISGIMSGQGFSVRLTGDASIQKRPMKRVIEPLSLMGASIVSETDNNCAPLLISPGRLKGITYHSKVASAQVKSAILLAGLYADGPTTTYEPVLSRDHTERMLSYLGADIRSIYNGTPGATIYPGRDLNARDITIPGDISSAAYFIAAASIVPGSDIILENVGLNHTRDGILRVLEAMGGDYEIIDLKEDGCEPMGDIRIRYSPLHGTVIEGDIIPTLIDEIPIIAIMAAAAEGETVIRDAAELKVKESDRIAVMTDNLRALGVDCTPTDDGMIIRGGYGIKGGQIDSHLDHRVAMSFAVADLVSDGDIKIKGRECVSISYPMFYEDLRSLL